MSLLLAAAPAAAVANGDDGRDGGGVWMEHAAPDGDVAREGRAAMPFTADQIEALGRLLRETQGAASLAADPVPEGRVRRVRIGSPGEGAVPAVAVRRGYVTAVSFTDATGAPGRSRRRWWTALPAAAGEGRRRAGRRRRRAPPALPGAQARPARQCGWQAGALAEPLA